MTKASKPSQKDIAIAAGVSQATVSFVLTHRSVENGISHDTQRRVEEAAQRLGYSPNVAAQSLRGGRTGLIGVHTYERIFPASPDHYYHQFLIGLEEEASSLGLDLVLFTSAQRSTSSRSVFEGGHNRMRLADGAVILGARKNDDELQRLADEGFPIVSVGRPSRPNPRIASVRADYRSALLTTVDQLAELGHRRILYTGHIERLPARTERFEGYLEGCDRRGIDAGAPAWTDPMSIRGQWVADVVRSGVTAIVAETTAHAHAIHTAALAAGVHTPADLSLVCLDVSSNPGDFVPWSHIVVPRYEMGRRALHLLHRLLDDPSVAGRVDSLACEPAHLSTLAAPSSAAA